MWCSLVEQGLDWKDVKTMSFDPKLVKSMQEIMKPSGPVKYVGRRAQKCKFGDPNRGITRFVE